MFYFSEKDEQQLEEAKRLKSEMLAALKARREALELKLKEKNELLKELCIKEGELTGTFDKKSRQKTHAIRQFQFHEKIFE